MSKPVQTFSGGITRNGKGDFYRISNADEVYKKNYNKIFGKKEKTSK